MKDATGPEDRDGAGVDVGQLVHDWITIWRSELGALAADREAQETWQSLLALWAGAAEVMLRAMPREGAHEREGRRAGTADAAGSTPAPAAPDARDAEIERLARRVAELEQRLDQLERVGGRGGGTGQKRGDRKGAAGRRGET